KVLERIEDEKSRAFETIEKSIKNLQSKDEFKGLDISQQQQVIQPFKDEKNKLQNQRYIAVIRDVRAKVREVLVSNQLNEMIRLVAPPPSSGGEVNEPKPHYIRGTSVKANYSKTELRTEADVDEYVEALRKSFKEQIKNNRRISL
ncbi:MAG: hypothetical protein HN686_17055, partial [Bacteroidetes bacterium]|nr:hypothetical protein [Bacteroidota bacterium]